MKKSPARGSFATRTSAIISGERIGRWVWSLLLSLSVLAALLVAPRWAKAQPIDTHARAWRLSVGIRSFPDDREVAVKDKSSTVPTEADAAQDPQNDSSNVAASSPAKTERVSEYQLVISPRMRVLPNLDIGARLPSMTVAPEIGFANPSLFAGIHLAHKPVWTAVFPSLELPAFVKNGWRASVWHGVSVPATDAFDVLVSEWFRVPLTNPRRFLSEFALAFVWNAAPFFAVGPQASIRVDIDGYAAYTTGMRTRWVWRKANGQTRAVFFVQASIADSKFQADELTLTAVSTWFFHFGGAADEAATSKATAEKG